MLSKVVADPEQVELIQASLPELCVETFPDNEENLWTVRKILNLGKSAFLLVEPKPKDVGADLFIFWLRFPVGQAIENPAVYSLVQAGVFSLQCTAPGSPENVPRLVKWTV